MDEHCALNFPLKISVGLRKIRSLHIFSEGELVYTTSYLDEHATEIAFLDIDSKPAADKHELKALIRQEVRAKKATEITTLKKKLDFMTKQIELLYGSETFQR